MLVEWRNRADGLEQEALQEEALRAFVASGWKAPDNAAPRLVAIVSAEKNDPMLGDVLASGYSEVRGWGLEVLAQRAARRARCLSAPGGA